MLSSILCVPKFFQNKNFRIIEDLASCEIYENFKVPTVKRAPIFIAITSVCPTILSFLIRNIFKAKKRCLEIKYNYAILEHMQTNSIVLNMNFWKNCKLTVPTKYFIEDGNLQIFGLVVSHLNCSRSITGTSTSTPLPLNSSSPTPG